MKIKAIDILIILALIVLIAVLVVFPWKTLFSLFQDAQVTGAAVVPNNSRILEAVSDRFSNSSELHWPNMPLSYRFENEEDCGSHEARRIRRAFANLQNETEGAVSFFETNESEDFLIVCHKGFNQTIGRDGTFTSAESTVRHNQSIITQVEIDFYDTKENKISSNCGMYPDTEVHEILHGFGFQHVDDRYNIMNPVQLSCPSKIDTNIIDKLKLIYSI